MYCMDQLDAVVAMKYGGVVFDSDWDCRLGVMRVVIG